MPPQLAALRDELVLYKAAAAAESQASAARHTQALEAAAEAAAAQRSEVEELRRLLGESQVLAARGTRRHWRLLL